MKIFRKIFWTVVIIGLIVYAVFQLSANKKASEEETRIVATTNDSIAVNTARAVMKEMERDYTVNGTFEASQEMMFPAETAGKVTRVMVREGSRVGVGQTLAIIRADAQSIDLEAARAAYENAQIDNQRFEAALQSGGVTQQQVDMSRLQLKNAKAQLDQAKIRVGDTNVKATISGVINQKFVEPGSFVSPGTPLFEIVNVSEVKLRVEVDESRVTGYKLGDAVMVKATAIPDREFVGKISFIAPKATTSMTFPVDILVSNRGEHELKAGMYGTAVFTSGEAGKSAPALLIPREAFVGGLNNSEVFVVRDGKAYLTRVVIGRNYGEEVEITSGLKEGDTVVTAGHINLTDGKAVKEMNRHAG